MIAWVVREPDDVGEPIVAISPTEEDAEFMAQVYRWVYPGSTPRVEPYTLDVRL